MTAARRQGDGPATIRAFLALDLPDPIRAGIADWGEAELRDSALRRVPPENLHLTLAFLGHVAEPELARAHAIVAEVTPRPVPVSLAPEPVARPRGRPRLLALDADSPAAVALQAELEELLVAAGVYEPEGRSFWPHVTVARVRAEPGRRRPRHVRRRPGLLPDDLAHTFDSVRVALYRSNLRPTGAQYVSLASTNLPPRHEPGGEG